MCSTAMKEACFSLRLPVSARGWRGRNDQARQLMSIPLADVSIIIVNYNTLNLLRDCLASLMQTEGGVCEIVVVDNASADGSAAMVEKEFPGVIVIRNRQNAGFSRANNQGIRQAKGKFFLLLN